MLAVMRFKLSGRMDIIRGCTPTPTFKSGSPRFVQVRGEIPGGDSKYGEITSQGVYTAPGVSDVMKVKVTTVSKLQPTHQDSTEVTVMPAAAQVQGVQAKFVNGKFEISWKALDQNRTGYTIWKRLPIGKERVGTIFEMVGATEIQQQNPYTCSACPRGDRTTACRLRVGFLGRFQWRQNRHRKVGFSHRQQDAQRPKYREAEKAMRAASLARDLTKSKKNSIKEPVNDEEIKDLN